MNVNSSAAALGACGDAIPPGNVQDFNFGFNLGTSDSGNVMSWTATGQQSFNRSFTFDSLNRLATLNQSSGSATGCSATFNLSWTYDAWGNRTDQNVNSGTCNSFHATVNTQNQLSGSPYQYDAAGNMTHDASHAYFYDAENRLASVDGGSTAQYGYDALGQRVEKTVGSAITQYVHDLNGQVILETDGNGNGSPIADYVYMGNLVSEYKNNTTYFVHTDHLGSARLLTGLNQSVVQNLDYLPFGELNSSDSGITTHKFTGDERDSETGLDHTWFRQYSSSLGRWMRPDPAGLAAVDPSNPQSWNRYAYVLNNPLAYKDPLGLECVWDDGSWDSISDPESGNSGSCGDLGGYWVDHSFFSDFGLGDWSVNGDLAAIVPGLQAGFALVQTGSGLSGWMLVANGGAGPIDWSLLINPVPLPDSAVQLGLALNATGVQSLGNPCTVVAWYGASAIGGSGVAAGMNAAAVAEAAATYWPNAAQAGSNWLYRQSLRGGPIANTLLNLPNTYNRVKTTLSNACNAMQ
jgi:RHS repeat-associated protein